MLSLGSMLSFGLDCKLGLGMFRTQHDWECLASMDTEAEKLGRSFSIEGITEPD